MKRTTKATAAAAVLAALAIPAVTLPGGSDPEPVKPVEAGPCVTVAMPERGQFSPATPQSWPGAWSDEAGNLVGYANFEDTPLYTDPACAVTDGEDSLDTLDPATTPEYRGGN